MKSQLVFCPHGWGMATTQNGYDWTTRMIDPPKSSPLRLSRGEIFGITPSLAIKIILVGAQRIALPSFCGDAKELRLAGSNSPLNEVTLRLDLNPLPTDRVGSENLEHGCWLTVDEQGYIARIDVYLGRWDHPRITPYRTFEEAEQSLYELSGLNRGCMVSCLVEIQGGYIPPHPKVLDVWLCANGQRDWMRWRIFPWPEKMPPPHVTR